MRPRFVAALAFSLAGCSLVTDSFVTNDFSGDLYPIDVDTSSGAVVVGLREADVADRVAVLDTLSPITLVDPGADVSPTVTYRNLTLLGERAATGALDLPRAGFRDTQVLSLHPCDSPDCAIGTAGTERPFAAIIGANSLAGDALRLRLGDDRAFILADVAGDEQARAAVCDAVYPSPFRGGGTLVVAGTELDFAGRRITMRTCIAPNPDPAIPQSARGVDALMLVSTGIGPTLLGTTAYERYRMLDPTALPVDQLPTGQVFLASGPVLGHVATVPDLALVARSNSTPRAACRHVFAHHLLLERNCAVGDDCPCNKNDTFCPLPALVEIAPTAGIEVLVIADSEPILQALRTELRPDQPEVDGILGVDALRDLELDVDYPHDRLLARCTTDACTMRAALPAQSDRSAVTRCLDVKK